MYLRDLMGGTISERSVTVTAKTKGIMRIAVALAVFFGAATAAMAGEEYDVTVGGWFMFVDRADNLWGNGHRKIDSIYSKPQSKAVFVAYPFVDVRYNPAALAKEENRFSFYLNTSLEPGSLSAGGRYDFGGSYLDVYGFYSLIAKNWQNPYVLYRTSTSTMNYGGKITYGNILGSDLYLSYRFGLTDVDKDVIGTLVPSLQQDGYTHTVAAGYRLKAGERFSIIPEVLYELGDYDGNANSYNSYGGAVAAEYRFDILKLSARVYGRKVKFDSMNPIYLETRDENYYGAGILAFYPDPFGFKNFILSVGLNANATNSNITFFDNHQTMGYMALGYSF
jgi:hypothetical protein